MALRRVSWNSTFHTCSPSEISVSITGRSSLLPFDDRTRRSSITGASTRIAPPERRWCGRTVNRTHGWPSTSKQGPAGQAKLRKFAVVKVPRSVYAAVPGRNKYRPSQETPIENFVMAGDYTSQKFLGSMEGAVLALSLIHI